MTSLVGPALVVLLVAFAASLAVLLRTGETRIGLLSAFFGFLAAPCAVLLHTAGDVPLGLDLATAAAGASVVAAVFGLLALVAVARTVRERDRAEALHWDSMEAVRVLGELSSRRGMSLDQKLDAILRVGCACFRLDVGCVARAGGDRYHVLALCAPPGFPVRRRADLSLDDTLCHAALEADRPIAIPRVADSAFAGTRTAFAFESYLGAPVHAGDAVFGTLCFGSGASRRERFTATDKDLLNLMAQCVGAELERAGLRESAERPAPAREKQLEPVGRDAPAAGFGSAPGSGAPRSRDAASGRSPRPKAAGANAGAGANGSRARRTLDANGILRRMERRLRRELGPDVELTLELAPDLPEADAPLVPLEAIARSLVLNARDAMPGGGRLILETTRIDMGTSRPDVCPAVAPDRYVTVAITDTGGGIDADALAAAFDPEGERAGDRALGLEGRLPLSAIYRVLQRCGGDLSVDVEAGRGTRFTVFLPLAGGAPAAETLPRDESTGAEPPSRAAGGRARPGARPADAPAPSPH